MEMPRCRRVAYSGQTSVWHIYIYYFLVFSIKNIYVLCFLMYMYYKRTLVVFGFTLARQCLEKVFRLARNLFK